MTLYILNFTLNEITDLSCTVKCEAVMQTWPIWRYYPGICVEKKENHKKMSQRYSWCSGWDTKQGYT